METLPSNIEILGRKEIDRNTFYQEMSRRIIRLSSSEYIAKVGYDGVAHFSGTVFQTDRGKLVNNGCILINNDKLIISGISYEHLLPVVIRHELAEIWLYAKTGFSLSPKPKWLKTDRVSIAHQIALKEEYKFAKELECQEEYLKFCILLANGNQNVISENQKAFEQLK